MACTSRRRLHRGEVDGCLRELARSRLYGRLDRYVEENPIGRAVIEHTTTSQIRVLAPGDELDGGDVLPRFRLPVRDLFDKAGQPG